MKVCYKINVEVDLDETSTETDSLRKTFSTEMEKTLNIINSDVMAKWYSKSVQSKLYIQDLNSDDYALIKQLKYTKDD